MIATLNQLKNNLNIEIGYTDEDEYLTMLLQVSEEAVFNYLGKTVIDFPVIPNPLVYAVIIMASQFYENRTPIAFGQPYKIPYSFEFLLSPYKDIIVL